MATICEMLETHNALARTLDQAELASWKQAGDKLQARIDAMQALVDADEADANEADQALLTSALDGTLMASLETVEPDPLGDVQVESVETVTETEVDPLTVEVKTDDEVIGDVLDVVQAIKAEKTKRAKKDKAPKVEDERGTIGQMVKDLLLDAEGYDYQEVLDIVKGEFPEANTSRRSIASVAADLRRKGIDVPMRRKQKGAK